MVFSSNIFLFFFLPIFLIAYFVTPQKFRNYTLLLFSLIFYAYGAPDFVFLLVGECIINYFIVRGMAKTEKTSTKKWLCALSVIMALGLLLYFKYANFFMENLNAILGWMHHEPVGWMKVALPIGISFFTFQSITYTLDVYRGTTPPSQKLTDYVLYIMMFPQLIAGPIVNYNSVAAQLVERTSTMEDRVVGFYRFIIGLGKKDSDMAIGLGKMMGFKFPENFNDPYTSRSVTEFWKRWHMTLGNFIMNYLYIPLGGNRKGKGRMYLNLWLCFLLSGLWHGASWTFVLWGAFHGLFICADKLFLKDLLKKAGKWPAVILTFFVVNMGWVLFRVDTAADAGGFYQALFAFKGGMTQPADLLFWVTFGLAVVFSFLTLFKGGQRLQDTIFADHYSKGLSWTMFAICLVLLILSAGSLCVSDFNPFIYFRF